MAKWGEVQAQGRGARRGQGQLSQALGAYLTQTKGIMATHFYLDAREFNTTLDKYLDLTRRERFNELNRRAANICARASGETPKADPDKIVDNLKATETITASYIKTTKRKGEYVALSKGGKTTQKKATIQYMARGEAFAIANWRLKRGKAMGFYKNFPNSLAGPGRGKSGGTASAHYSRFVKRARSSAGYIAAGWLPAFNFFREIITGKSLSPEARLLKYFPTLAGSAGNGFGFNAVAGGGDIVKAVFANAAAGVGKYGQLALQKAINAEEADMQIKIAKKQQEIADKVNR